MKVGCEECDWRGQMSEVDYVEDPRPLPGTKADNWVICPQCRTPEHLREVCDEPECQSFTTCGTNTPNGYRRTCSDHWPDRLKGATGSHGI